VVINGAIPAKFTKPKLVPSVKLVQFMLLDTKVRNVAGKSKIVRGALEALYDLNPIIREFIIDPKLMRKSWKQQKDLYDITYQDHAGPTQDIMSAPQLRENIAGIEKWIESKKDQPAFEDVIYLFTKRAQELKEQLGKVTEIEEVDID